MQSRCRGQMLVSYAAGGDIAGVKKALASGDRTISMHAGEAYWVAAGRGHSNIMKLISDRYDISDADKTTARNRAVMYNQKDCVARVDKITDKNTPSQTYHHGNVTINIFYK